MTEETGGLLPGLYDLILTKEIKIRLDELDHRLVETKPLDEAEAANRVALHLGHQIERILEGISDKKDRLAAAVEVVSRVLAQLESIDPDAALGEQILAEPAVVLRQIAGVQPDGSPRAVRYPEMRLLDTTLLTNAPGEPRVGHQIATEIESADEISVVMAFVRLTGVNPLLEGIRHHCAAGRRFRLLTTTYTGSTEKRALDALIDAGAEVKVSYDVSSTRLHAKSWLFHRKTGFSTAYIGSSNLTFSAQVEGLEWNVRLSAARNTDVIEKFRAVFESYWNSPDFEPYVPEIFAERTQSASASGPVVYLSPVGVSPLPFQERMLELLAVERSRGRHRNLLVSATGTGKTVMAALDYAELQSTMQRSRLLFVAHRREILNQSQATFRHVLRDPGFGEQWIQGARPTRFEHVFASIQTLNAADLEHLARDHFDVVIIDEFHHAAAASYDRLLRHVQPVELLGLTATPERADGESVLHWFDGKIAAELRLWDAIDQHYLVPFDYYGIFDGLDLRDIPWKRGVGYDVVGLTGLLTANDVWAKQVIKQFVAKTPEPQQARALGFCVSVEHAHYMARVFNEAGIRAVAVSGQTSSTDREGALKALAAGELQVVFSVDVFNEGVDVPNVDVLLLLRPTDSATLFLQQLGRGLRRAKDKASCLVLDFVGLHRREFRFDRRFGALLGGTRTELMKQIEDGFPFLPAGCHMELDRKAREIVLEGIRSAIPSNWTQKVGALRTMLDSGHPRVLADFLEHSGVELAELYAGGKSWSDLCDAAEPEVAASDPNESPVRRAIGRLLHADDDLRINGWLGMLSGTAPDVASLSEVDRRLLRMLLAQLLGEVSSLVLPKTASLQQAVDLMWSYPRVRSELLELLPLLAQRIEHQTVELERRPTVPLRIHSRYTRLEILAAFGQGDGPRIPAWQAGVFWLPDARADLFAMTLDKSTGGFSPRTRYRDYAISRDLIHWESQANTRESSGTGLRYQHHRAEGSDVCLFARLKSTDRALWFLGPADYVRHEGERPMAITWRLHCPLPVDLFAQFAAAVA